MARPAYHRYDLSLGIKFEPGSGVGAAVLHLAKAGEAMRMAAE